MYLGIDVGGTKIAAALVDSDGNRAEKIREPVDLSDDKSAIDQIKRIIAGLQRPEAGGWRREMAGIGVAVPGIADQQRRTVWAPNIRGWDHIPLQDQLQSAAGLPVTVESDRNSGVLGEWLYGAARGKCDVIFLIIGTGIGAGIISGGNLVRGRRDIGGAVGWFPMCFRGSVQHFEKVAAGPAIENIAAAMGLPGDLPELARTARSGNRPAAELFTEVGAIVGQALAVLVSTFNPELVILGGGVSYAWELMQDSAQSSMRLWGQPIAVEQVELRVSRLGEDAGILGAAAAARFNQSL
ncbi:MAG: ROK family protein [Acidobacteriota bacterium]